jgi:hypothetical protein
MHMFIGPDRLFQLILCRSGAASIIEEAPVEIGAGFLKSQDHTPRGITEDMRKGGSVEPPPGCAGVTCAFSWTWPLRRRRLLPVSRS